MPPEQTGFSRSLSTIIGRRTLDAWAEQVNSQGMGIPGWEHIERSDEMIALVVRNAHAQALEFAGRRCLLCKFPVTTDDGAPMSPDHGPFHRHLEIWAHSACMADVPRFVPPLEVLAAVSPCVRAALMA